MQPDWVGMKTSKKDTDRPPAHPSTDGQMDGHQTESRRNGWTLDRETETEW